MHMSLIAEVTHIMCIRYNCHPITIKDVATSLNVARHDVSLLINSLALPCSHSILIFYSKWLQDCNSKDVFQNYKEYLV